MRLPIPGKLEHRVCDLRLREPPQHRDGLLFRTIQTQSIPDPYPNPLHRTQFVRPFERKQVDAQRVSIHETINAVRHHRVKQQIKVRCQNRFQECMDPSLLLQLQFHGGPHVRLHSTRVALFVL